ncbi:hypothetical protein GCM10010168_85890 [Actinoplanes ianthinogenes]|uniref:Uncharacterized protein n=1 Tax=Actinoplanes ianthinogenes TaxID=122358 RepID=A0ABN6CK01_9ACTN|nr:hypothetical protein [Actinoplanes ianthinogenes]BCJ45320.1 hypothetical protein Aiant_59770 [Actinoplanes ianthinogenes]GGR53760.1 hypothetical protein GCM10010168_85890 [Actinoplanes ianthinogenes]
MTAQATAYNVTGTGQVVTGVCTYRGLSVGSTAGAAVVVYDGTSAAGTVLASFTLGANGFQDIALPDGVRCNLGIYVSSTAAIQGHVRVG